VPLWLRCAEEESRTLEPGDKIRLLEAGQPAGSAAEPQTIMPRLPCTVDLDRTDYPAFLLCRTELEDDAHDQVTGLLASTRASDP
jgi:hypothetical protein